MKTPKLLAVLLVFLLSACWPIKSTFYLDNYPINFIVTPDAETDPVVALIDDDAADDPAIWVHPGDPKKSILIGTNKKSGLYTYTLEGKKIDFLPLGRLNNVDILPDFQTNEEAIILIGATNRSDSTLSLVSMDEEGKLRDVANRKIQSGLQDDVYGFCFYQSQKTGISYAFLNAKGGGIEQYELQADGDRVDALLVRSFSVPSQPEGMVADPVNGVLFVGEETCCIHKFDAEPDGDNTGMIIPDTDSLNPAIVYDIEGLSVYRRNKTHSYLVVSIQGANAFGLYELEEPHAFLGNFIIAGSKTIDSVEETDGIETTSASLGERYPMGVLVVQDGLNTDGRDTLAQNFKVIDWRKIERGLRGR